MAEELTFQSVGALPIAEELGQEDHLLAVVGGAGRRIPAGKVQAGGGGAPDAVIGMTSTDSGFTGTLISGSYDGLMSVYNSGKMPNVLFKCTDTAINSTAYVPCITFAHVSGAVTGGEDMVMMMGAVYSMSTSTLIHFGAGMTAGGTIVIQVLGA